MVQRITRIIKDYQEGLREMPYVPRTSFRRDSLGYCGDANKLFLAFLFSDHTIGLQFLKDVGLIRSKVQCNSCGRDMTARRSYRLKAFLRPYNRQEDYEYHLAHYMFAARFNALDVSQFTHFLAIAASTDWSSLPTTVTSPSGAT